MGQANWLIAKKKKERKEKKGWTFEAPPTNNMKHNMYL
jgi:hypothetical protein